LSRSGAGRKSLKKYEVANLLFFLGLILALGILVTFVFRYYGNKDRTAIGEAETGIVSEVLSQGSDIGMFYLGTNIFERSRQYRNSMEIPVTDDGFLKELFSIPGVVEITVDKRSILIKKESSASWESMLPRIHQAIEKHLHMHF
jgi:hypothetical protein